MQPNPAFFCMCPASRQFQLPTHIVFHFPSNAYQQQRASASLHAGDSDAYPRNREQLVHTTASQLAMVQTMMQSVLIQLLVLGTTNRPCVCIQFHHVPQGQPGAAQGSTAQQRMAALKAKPSSTGGSSLLAEKMAIMAAARTAAGAGTASASAAGLNIPDRRAAWSKTGVIALRDMQLAAVQPEWLEGA